MLAPNKAAAASPEKLPPRHAGLSSRRFPTFGGRSTNRILRQPDRVAQIWRGPKTNSATTRQAARLAENESGPSSITSSGREHNRLHSKAGFFRSAKTAVFLRLGALIFRQSPPQRPR